MPSGPKTIYIYTDDEANYHATGTGSDIRTYNGPSVSGRNEIIGEKHISAGIPIADDEGKGYQALDANAIKRIDIAFAYISDVLLESGKFDEIHYHVDNGKLATFAIRFDDIGLSPPPKKPRVIKYDVSDEVKDYIMFKIDHLVKEYEIKTRQFVSDLSNFEAATSLEISRSLHRTKYGV